MMKARMIEVRQKTGNLLHQRVLKAAAVIQMTVLKMTMALNKKRKVMLKKRVRKVRLMRRKMKLMKMVNKGRRLLKVVLRQEVGRRE